MEHEIEAKATVDATLPASRAYGKRSLTMKHQIEAKATVDATLTLKFESIDEVQELIQGIEFMLDVVPTGTFNRSAVSELLHNLRQTTRHMRSVTLGYRTGTTEANHEDYED